MTPEGRIKKEVKRILDSFNVYWLCPVMYGMGAASLDFHCVVRAVMVPGDHALGVFVETGRRANCDRKKDEGQA